MGYARMTRRERAAAPVLVVATAALLAACGSTTTPSGSTSAPAPQAASPSSSATGSTVTATETDFRIALSQQSFQPGTYTFQVTNAGRFPHALTIDGPGVSSQTTGIVDAGRSRNLTVALQAGDYTVFCPVDGHRGKGMLLNLSVADSGGYGY